MTGVDRDVLRAAQQPLTDRYREEPEPALSASLEVAPPA